jgi:hypothetical protein
MENILDRRHRSLQPEKSDTRTAITYENKELLCTLA